MRIARRFNAGNGGLNYASPEGTVESVACSCTKNVVPDRGLDCQPSLRDERTNMPNLQPRREPWDSVRAKRKPRQGRQSQRIMRPIVAIFSVAPPAGD